jgi:Flp pilus assembly protein TadD
MAHDVEQGLRAAPDDARLLCLRGVVAMLDRRGDAALADFAAALERQPGLADAWANRAVVHVRRGDLELALADIKHALALRDDPAIRGNRERILERLSRKAEAPVRG